MHEVKYIIGVVALCCALATGWYVSTLRTENKRLGGANAALVLDLERSQKLRETEQAVQIKYASEVLKLKQQKKVVDAKLKQALAANASWADQVVPLSVADALGLQLPADAD